MRSLRTPNHTYFGKQRPWVLQPVAVARAFAGESLVGGNYEFRCQTDPLKAVDGADLVGWHAEFMVFNVKLRRMRATVGEFFTDSVAWPFSTAASDKVTCYTKAGQYDLVTEALNAIWEDIFARDKDGSISATRRIENLPILPHTADGWFRRAVLRSALPTGTAVTAETVEVLMDEWERKRLEMMDDISFEEFAGLAGVQTLAKDTERVETLRYVREFAYPSSTVDPATGAPSAALSWLLKGKFASSKAFYFREPSVLLACLAFRPKVYMQRLQGNFLGELGTLPDWIPPYHYSNPDSALRTFDNVNGIWADTVVAATGDDFFVDVRDVDLIGDQFLSAAPTATFPFVPLPSESDLTDQRFIPNTAANFERPFLSAAGRIRADGRVGFGIKTPLARPRTGATPG